MLHIIEYRYVPTYIYLNFTQTERQNQTDIKTLLRLIRLICQDLKRRRVRGQKQEQR
jgi:hypothetical protein